VKEKAEVQKVIDKAVEAILTGEESSHEYEDSDEEENQNVSTTEPLETLTSQAEPTR
jgi:hypothetical protein